MYFPCRILTTSMTLLMGTTKLRDTSDAPSEIISTLASASFTAVNMSAETPHLPSRLSPTAHIRATWFFTSILSISYPSRQFSFLRVFLTSLLWTRNATVESDVDIE